MKNNAVTKFLITGGAGNIGGNLARRLVKNPNYQVVVADNLSTGAASKLPDSKHANFRFIKADTNRYDQIETIFDQHHFDYVFHYAAVVGVKRTIDYPLRVLRDIQGIENILSLAHKHRAKRVFYSSSSEVYGEPFEIPQHEDTTPLNSRLPYAIVKNAGEAYARSYQKEYGLAFTIFRFFNTYSSLQSTDFVMAKFIEAALSGEDIIINGDGTQTRTFCHVEDNLEFTEKLLETGGGVNELYNVGSDHEITILELAETILRITGSNSNIRFVAALEEGDMSRRCPDVSKMKAVLGREPISLEEGIGRLLKDRGHPEKLAETA